MPFGQDLLAENARSLKRRGRSEADAVREAIAAQPVADDAMVEGAAPVFNTDLLGGNTGFTGGKAAPAIGGMPKMGVPPMARTMPGVPPPAGVMLPPPPPGTGPLPSPRMPGEGGMPGGPIAKMPGAVVGPIDPSMQMREGGAPASLEDALLKRQLMHGG